MSVYNAARSGLQCRERDMALLRIVTVFDADADVLRQKARRVTQFGPQLQRLAENMLETMRDSHGVGLAAPQVGLPIRLFVAEVPEDMEDEPHAGESYVFVNPKIIKVGREEVEREEGCLSIPGIYGDVWRPDEVVVRAQDARGHQFRLRAKGFLARIILHEYDHLEGILFVDRVEDPATLHTYEEQGDELVAVPVDFPRHLIRPLREPVLVRSR